MLTPFVIMLVLANATAAAFAWPWAAFIGELSSIDEDSQTLMQIKQGDRLLFGRGSPTEIKTDGEELPTMNASDILGMVEDSAKRRKAA
jgi:hypothetical protein